MADDVTIKNASSAVETIAADEVGGKKYQIVKMALGADGTATQMEPGQQTAAKSMPVVLPSAQLTALTDALTALLTEMQKKSDLTEIQPVAEQNFTKVSTLNSFAGDLEDTFWNGQWEDCSEFTEIVVCGSIDRSENAVIVKFSSDGINTDCQSKYVVVGPTTTGVSVPVRGKFFMVLFGDI